MHTASLESDEPPERKISCTSVVLSFQWWFHLIFTLLGIVIFIVTISSYKDLSNEDKFIEDYKYNWKLLPLVDIEITKNSNCPEGYENLLDRKFGTNVGCSCYDTIHNKTTITVGNCEINQTYHGWERVPPVGPVILNKFYSYRICGFREGQNFLEVDRPIKNKNLLEWPKNK